MPSTSNRSNSRPAYPAGGGPAPDSNSAHRHPAQRPSFACTPRRDLRLTVPRGPARQHLRDGSSARRDLRSTAPQGPARQLSRTTAPHLPAPRDGPTKTRTTAPRTWHGVWVFTAREESFLRRRQSDEKRKKFGFSEKNTYLATQNVCRTPVSERAKAHKDKTINTKKDCLSEENSTLSN